MLTLVLGHFEAFEEGLNVRWRLPPVSVRNFLGLGQEAVNVVGTPLPY